MLNIFQALVYLILIITLSSLSGNVPLEKKKENQLFKNSFLKSQCFPAQLLLITILLYEHSQFSQLQGKHVRSRSSQHPGEQGKEKT